MEAAALRGSRGARGGYAGVGGARCRRARRDHQRRHCASSSEQHGDMVWLLAGAKLNRRNTVGDTPLFQAIHGGRVSAVTELVAAVEQLRHALTAAQP
jgi:hypothetical protein